jgi:hypothetical protein
VWVLVLTTYLLPWKVNAKLPAESTEADVENHKQNGDTLLYVFGRGLAASDLAHFVSDSTTMNFSNLYQQIFDQAISANQLNIFMLKVLLGHDTCFLLFTMVLFCYSRDSIGSSSIVGDKRWAGAFGVDADFIARGHCSVEFIKIEDIEVFLTRTSITSAQSHLPFVVITAL